MFFANSLLYSVISCVGVLAISTPAAYVFSRWEFTGGKTLRIGLVIAMSVPGIMVIMPITPCPCSGASRAGYCWSSCTSCSEYPTPAGLLLRPVPHL